MIIKKFEEQVEQFTDKIAVIDKEISITYGHLNCRANSIAHEIISFDEQIKNHDLYNISILIEHGLDAIVGIIGILKAGKTYIPLDVNYPQKRLLYIVEHSESYVIITNNRNLTKTESLISQLENKVKIINIDTLDKGHGETNILRTIDGKKPAYILYTSGSTGIPKGVVQSNENVIYFIENWSSKFSIEETQRIIFLSSLSHDASIPDIFSALLNGATLYPYDIKAQPDMNRLIQLIQQERITVWHSVPTFYRFFTRSLDSYQKFTDLRLIILGGEEVRTHDVILFKSFFPYSQFANIYGQTESTVNSIWMISVDDVISKITIGEPIGDTQILVIDEDGYLVEEMCTGEIVIDSENIALHYWKDDKTTNQVFKYSNELGRLYWTGDLGQVMADGNISIVGRKDFQLKIRGFRVEAGEIESALMQHPAVEEVVVIARKDENSDNYLCAYFVSSENLSQSILRDHISALLPDYMNPRYFINVEQMPLTANGKLDRKALPEPVETEIQQLEYEAPNTETEIKLANIWKDLMRKDTIGINDNFFSIGGHSLLVITLISRIHKVFNTVLQLKDIFDNPTIKELSQFIIGANSTDFLSIQPVEKKEYYSTTSNQKSMYVLNQFEGIGTTYNLPVAIRLEGNIEFDQMESIFQILIKRHESFRSYFKMIEDELKQFINEGLNSQIKYLDVENQGLKERNDLRKFVKNFIQPFNLNIYPLFRILLAKIAPNEYLLVMDSHHIITDGLSGGILSNEFFRLYTGEQLPELRLKYKDFSEWQKINEHSDSYKRQEKYWLDIYSNAIPSLNLPTDFPRPSIQSFEGRILPFTLEKDIVTQLNNMGRKTGTTLFMVLLAMYNVLLHKYSHQEDIIVGTNTAGRYHADLGNIVGFFVQTLALRNHIATNQTFDQILEVIKKNTLDAFENQVYPFNNLVEKLGLKKDYTRNPLFDTAFVLQNGITILSEDRYDTKGLKLTPVGFENQTSLFDLYFEALESEGSLYCIFQYNTKLFKKETIELMIEHFSILIRNILNDSSTKLSNLEFATPFEREIGTFQEIEFDL